MRGEIKSSQNDARPPKHSIRDRSNANGSSAVELEILSNQNTSTNKSFPQPEQQTSIAIEHPKITNPLTSPVPVDAQSESPVTTVDGRTSQNDQIMITEKQSDSSSLLEPESAEALTTITPQKQTSEQGSITTPAILQSQELTQAQPSPQFEVTIKEHNSTTVLVSEEDVVIFEQMRHQLVVWARVEAVRAGIDIAGHEPSELVELLQQLDGFDETRLQVTSTLINLCDQIIAAGQASLLEYKQAIMFYLMHTRSSR